MIKTKNKVVAFSSLSILFAILGLAGIALNALMYFKVLTFDSKLTEMFHYVSFGVSGASMLFVLIFSTVAIIVSKNGLKKYIKNEKEQWEAKVNSTKDAEIETVQPKEVSDALNFDKKVEINITPSTAPQIIDSNNIKEPVKIVSSDGTTTRVYKESEEIVTMQAAMRPAITTPPQNVSTSQTPINTVQSQPVTISVSSQPVTSSVSPTPSSRPSISITPGGMRTNPSINRPIDVAPRPITPQVPMGGPQRPMPGQPMNVQPGQSIPERPQQTPIIRDIPQKQ